MRISHSTSVTEILSRLTWKTNLVKHPYFHFAKDFNYSDSKNFIGKINTKERTFMLRRNRVLYLFWMPQLYILGEIEKNELRLRIRPGLGTSAFYLILLFLVIQGLSMSLRPTNHISSMDLLNIVVVLLIVIGLTLLETHNLKKIFIKTIGLG